MNILRRPTMEVSRLVRQGLGRFGITGRVQVVAVLVFFLTQIHPMYAADLTCPSGDVACLIEAIHTANKNGEANTIALEAGTYRLPDIDNTMDGPNGLPSITSTLTITGVEAEMMETAIERNANATAPLRIFHVAPSGTLTLERLVIRGGEVPSASGGGLFNRGTVIMTYSTVVGNRAQEGGGLFNRGTMTIMHSTLAGNSGLASTGGLFNQGSLTLSNSTIADNAAQRHGGLTNAGTMAITNSTIARNVALSGAGGIANRSHERTLTLQNSILANNIASESPDCSNPLTSLGTNLFGNLAGCPITPAPSDQIGSPGLAEFSDVGAPGRGHFPLLVNSEAIDAGREAACPPTDQIDNPRNGDCDIGAIEFQRLPPPTTGLAKED